jgi:Xaa-Pro dipeptidase
MSTPLHSVDRARLRATYADHVAALGRRIAGILDESGLDALVIHSGSLKSRSDFDDQYWPLRPVPHFQHWLPLAEPDCALVVAKAARPRLLWLREGNFWEHLAAPDSDHWQEHFAIAEPKSLEALRAELPRAGRVAFVGEDRRRAAEWGFADERVNPPALVRALDALRTRKTAYELLCLDEANRRAALGHRAVREAFFAGEHSELELHLLYLRATAQDDPETPYKNIVALGANAATLHHVSYGRRATAQPPATSLLLDAGATFQGYASDVTRTLVKGTGEVAGLFRELVVRTERLQQALCREVRVGVPYEQLHERSHQLVAEVLVDLGIARASADEVVSTGVSRAFYPHGLGHSLGLQTHDVGCALVKPKPENPFLRNTSVIAEEQVFTIEPGIYFIDLLLGPLRASAVGERIDWRLVEALAPCGGVRIEDDLHVRGAGAPAENLTRAHLPA